MEVEDEKFMLVALQCASLGRGAVEPNPMVGAVLARDGRELARGWHRRFGGPHAEVEALSAAQAAGQDVRGATLYVTLEPCCHFGKTPPCTDAIVRSGIGRVVAAMQDPDARVAGKGFAILRQGGIDVRVGVLEADARRLLGPYIKLRTQRRPWVIAKWAQTADGYLALPPDQGRWVSSQASRTYVHELRGQCDGICVGIGTVLADDPMLTNRAGAGKQPVRLVLDSHLRIPAESRLVRSAGEFPLLVATAEELARSPKADELKTAGAQVLAVPHGPGGLLLPALLDELGMRQWTYLLVEGGPKMLESFVEGDLADEWMVFVSPLRCGPAGGDLPNFDVARLGRRRPVPVPSRQPFGDDVLFRYLLR